jgi:UPF0716 family protein affecting phage T7 exclusion
MNNDDLAKRISRIEDEIERLTRVSEGCRKFILFAKVGIGLGVLVLVATVFRLIGFDPALFVGSIAAILGGLVIAGSNKTTLNQALETARSAEHLRAELIDQIQFRDL